jgi:hypothetical protein
MAISGSAHFVKHSDGLTEAHHERCNCESRICPFALSTVEGLRGNFATEVKDPFKLKFADLVDLSTRWGQISGNGGAP